MAFHHEMGYPQGPQGLTYPQGIGYAQGIGYSQGKYESVEVQEVGPIDDGLGLRVNQLRESNRRWRRYAHVLLFVYRLASTVLSAFVLATLAYSLAEYLETKDLTIADGSNVWPTNLVLWPTYLLLGVAFVTFVSNGLLLFIPCMHRHRSDYDYVNPSDRVAVKAARKRTDRLLSASQYVAIALYFIAWAVSSGLYQFANTGNDLWGCTCSATADEIQPQVQSFLNFGRLCSVQGAGWHAMIAHAAVWALAGATYIVAIWRWRRRRALKKLEEQHEIRQSVVSYVP